MSALLALHLGDEKGVLRFYLLYMYSVGDKIGGTSTIINRLQSAILIFADCILHCLRFALSLNKIGDTRKCKEKQVFLCHFTRLHYLCRKIGIDGYKLTKNESIL